MGIVSLVFGILLIIMAVTAWLPCLGWTNWFLWIIPLIFIIISAVAIGVDKEHRGMAIAGLVLSILAFISCLVRGFIAIFLAGA